MALSISPRTRCCPCWVKLAADITNCKSPEEIREVLNIKTDVTPEEEEQTDRENEWIHDPAERTSNSTTPSHYIPPCPCPCSCHLDSSSPKTSAPLSSHELVASGTLRDPCVFYNPFTNHETPVERERLREAFQIHPPGQEPKSTAGFFKKHDKFVQDSISKEGPYISRRAVNRGRPREPFKSQWVGVALPTTPPESTTSGPRRPLKQPRRFSSTDEEGEIPERYVKRPRVTRNISPSDGDDEPQTLLRGVDEESDEYHHHPLQERQGFRLHSAPKWYKESCVKYHYPRAVRAARSVRDCYTSDRYAKVGSLLRRRRMERKRRAKLVERHEPEDYFGRYEAEEDEPRALCRRWDDDDSEAGSETSRRNERYRHRQDLQDRDLEEYHLHREHLRHQHVIDSRQAAEDREIEIREIVERDLAAKRTALHGDADAFESEELEDPKEVRSGSTSSSYSESDRNDAESVAEDAHVDRFAAAATAIFQGTSLTDEPCSPLPATERPSSAEARPSESQPRPSEQSATDHDANATTQRPYPEATPDNRGEGSRITMARAQHRRDRLIMPGKRDDGRASRQIKDRQIKQQTNNKDKNYLRFNGNGDNKRSFGGNKHASR
ncbi:uncharacterized protein BDZ99DRAFT_531820 [Mytilinidion resinicola]|uniref:SKP1 component dimerisation domain-containing protein n=1 Tax=Mytilinidion resinicola TaxID=574789 RepID=A0A6A6YLQ5_9PEZI|nr:uncharacterized protein BDZ99DRAFT_531820 [Mytilinidion resinicola]KAF2809468.1 hypothetical protein BDZ99DRAFT_531820 [Mytilinidion resinicola]